MCPISLVQKYFVYIAIKRCCYCIHYDIIRAIVVVFVCVSLWCFYFCRTFLALFERKLSNVVDIFVVACHAKICNPAYCVLMCWWERGTTDAYITTYIYTYKKLVKFLFMPHTIFVYSRWTEVADFILVCSRLFVVFCSVRMCVTAASGFKIFCLNFCRITFCFYTFLCMTDYASESANRFWLLLSIKVPLLLEFF